MGLRRKRAKTSGKVASKFPLLCQTYHILDSMFEIFLSCDPDFQPLLGERRGSHIPTLPALGTFPAHSSPILPPSPLPGCWLPAMLLPPRIHCYRASSGWKTRRMAPCLDPSPYLPLPRPLLPPHPRVDSHFSGLLLTSAAHSSKLFLNLNLEQRTL